MTKLDSWTGVRVRIQKLALESEFKVMEEDDSDKLEA